MCATIALLTFSALLLGESLEVRNFRATPLKSKMHRHRANVSSIPLQEDGVPDVAFLRIQKTGGTTFGERVMPKLCAGSLCHGKFHTDWNMVQDTPKIVTMLRDPVERTLSEFTFLRNNRKSFDQAQWDVPDSMKEKLWDTLQAGDIMAYLQEKGNPSRNRQTLYLAGFKGDKPGIHMKNETLSVVDGVDWAKDGHKILRLAKKHLASPNMVFGLNEQYGCSMRVIAKGLGWDAEKAVLISKRVATHNKKKARVQDKASEAQAIDGSHVDPDENPKDAAQSWAAHFDLSVMKKIEQVNSMDVELYKFAVRRFAQLKHGMKC